MPWLGGAAIAVGLLITGARAGLEKMGYIESAEKENRPVATRQEDAPSPIASIRASDRVQSVLD